MAGINNIRKDGKTTVRGVTVVGDKATADSVCAELRGSTVDSSDIITDKDSHVLAAADSSVMLSTVKVGRNGTIISSSGINETECDGDSVFQRSSVAMSSVGRGCVVANSEIELCEIRDGALVIDSIAEKCEIGMGAVLEGGVVLRNVEVPDGFTVRRNLSITLPNTLSGLVTSSCGFTVRADGAVLKVNCATYRVTEGAYGYDKEKGPDSDTALAVSVYDASGGISLTMDLKIEEFNRYFGIVKEYADRKKKEDKDPDRWDSIGKALEKAGGIIKSLVLE